jgi:hypothetical protein
MTLIHTTLSWTFSSVTETFQFVITVVSDLFCYNNIPFHISTSFLDMVCIFIVRDKEANDIVDQ